MDNVVKLAIQAELTEKLRAQRLQEGRPAPHYEIVVFDGPIPAILIESGLVNVSRYDAATNTVTADEYIDRKTGGEVRIIPLGCNDAGERHVYDVHTERLHIQMDHEPLTLAEVCAQVEAFLASVNPPIELSAEDVAWNEDVRAQRAASARSRAAEQEARRIAEIERAERRKADQDEAETGLRTWAESNGDDLLRARIADGYKWLALAKRQRAENILSGAGVLPGILSSDNEIDEIDEPDGWERKDTPTLAEITAQRQITEALGQTGEATIIRWEQQDEDNGEVEHVSGLEVEIIVAESGEYRATKALYFTL